MSDSKTSVEARLGVAADDLVVGSAPVTAIIGAGRRRARTRTVGTFAFGLAAVGAAVAVGTSTVAGVSAGAVSAAAGTPAAPNAHPTNAGRTSVPNNTSDARYRDTVTIVSGTLGGTTWRLQRTVGVGVPEANDPKQECGRGIGDVSYEKTAIVTADGVSDDADIPATACSPQGSPRPWDHSTDFKTAYAIGYTVIRLGTTAKEQPSKYGTVVVGLVDDTAVGKVVLKDHDGQAAVTGQLVKAPAPENGAYFVIPLTDKGLENLSSDLEFYDLSGKVIAQPFRR